MAPFQPFRLLLQRNQREMVGIHFGHQQRHELLHPVVARVADDEVAGRGKFALDVARDLRIEAREHQPRRAAGRRRLDDHVVDLGRTRRRQAPREIAIFLAFGSLARAEPRDAEPGMIGELHDELLPHHAGGAKDADVYSAGNH